MRSPPDIPSSLCPHHHFHSGSLDSPDRHHVYLHGRSSHRYRNHLALFTAIPKVVTEFQVVSHHTDSFHYLGTIAEQNDIGKRGRDSTLFDEKGFEGHKSEIAARGVYRSSRKSARVYSSLHR